MSGIECAGLVLAVLPLVIEAAKSYKHGVDTILDVVSSSRRDDKLEGFYEDIWWEMFFIDRQLRDVIHALPFLAEDRKVDLLKAEHLSQWTRDSEVTEALKEYFKLETDFQAFTVIMGKIVQLLAQLLKDSSARIDRKEMVSDASHTAARRSRCLGRLNPPLILIFRTKWGCIGSSKRSKRSVKSRQPPVPPKSAFAFGRRKRIARRV